MPKSNTVAVVNYVCLIKKYRSLTRYIMVLALMGIHCLQIKGQKLRDGEIIAGLASYRNNIIRQDEQAYLQIVGSVNNEYPLKQEP
jgi:hypothetical protein